jgi:hypothetical protein
MLGNTNLIPAWLGGIMDYKAWFYSPVQDNIWIKARFQRSLDIGRYTFEISLKHRIN